MNVYNHCAVPQNNRPPIAPRRVLKWGRVLPLTHIRVNAIAQRYGVKYNKLGLVLDALVDALANLDGLNIISTPKYRLPCGGRPGRLNEEQVRGIRRSKEKPLAIALENGVSESMVRAIRGRLAYKWVR